MALARAQQGDDTTTSYATPQGTRVSKATGCAVFGSGCGGQVSSFPDMGTPAIQMMATTEARAFPGFTGGAGDHDVTMIHTSEDEAGDVKDDSMRGHTSPLDFVAQCLQCRLGNPNNRCFANAAFRLWAWAGSFMDGKQL